MDNSVIGGGVITTALLKEEQSPPHHCQRRGLVVRFGHKGCSSPTRFGLRSKLNVVKPDLEVGALAHVGLVAPIDVVVPLGNTGLDPSQTSFF
ncbi:hypothetical protein JHK85_025636 [Glycine max]|nr:hypothetical protein JHK85_025636 [Glycine max]KAG5012878.1 hypothetical protein JHK86_025139 [Glycine max]